MGCIANWFDEAYQTLEAILFNRWTWIIIGCMCAMATLPLFIIWIMLMVPSWLSATMTILIIVGWGVAGGYKEYLVHKRKMEEAKSKGEEFNPATYDEYIEKKRRYRIRP